MRLFLFLLLSLSAIATSNGQGIRKCGYDYVHKDVGAKYPEVRGLPEVPALKTTADSAVTIPVVFHIILTKQQLAQLGSESLIDTFIDAQVASITKDFMAMNADSVKIPEQFKDRYGNARMKFARAHTAPDGSATPGYEIKTTTKTGFNFTTNTYGSQTAFSDAKYAVSGGLDAWDPSTYLNIWVVNPLDDNTATDILGLCIPPSFAYSRNFPAGEVGVVLHYAHTAHFI
ncbi:MAG: C-terminal target protein [Flavipsychrobacter sp.]|nr:C-terminal target protein [Flavipsychrobacter sp.]